MDGLLRRWVAVVFAILMASSLVAVPVVAGTPDRTTDAEWQRGSNVDVSTAANPILFGPPGQGPPGSGGPGNGDGGPPGQGGGPPGHERGDVSAIAVPELPENTSIETVLAATERLGELDLEGDDASAVANDTVSAINATLQEYRRTQRVDARAAFDHASDAQDSLAELRQYVDEDAERTVFEISAELYAASNASARLAVADAKRVVDEHDGEFRNPGQRQKAESALGNAVDALERADTAVAHESVSPTERARALTHLRNAWKHANRALDTVEDNAQPALSLERGPAFEDNGTVLVSVKATLGDVRPYAYDTGTVSVDGDATGTIQFVSGGEAGGSAVGSTLIDVGPDAENATVTVRATAAHDADRTVESTREIVVDEDEIAPDLPAPDEYAEVSVENESSGVRVDVGGEGLHESHIDVRDVTPDGEDAYRAGPMVRIENRTAFDEATVSVPVDEGALDREGNLSIVTWDPESDEPWTAVETEVDRDAGVLRADVEHFSFFSVFRIDNWEDETSATLNLTAEYDGNVTGPGNGSIEKIDATFVIDESGSMGGTPISYAKTAGKRFVGALTEDERAALVSFDSYASLRRGLTTDHDAVNASIDGLYGSGGTDTAAGLRTGLNHIQSAGWENRSQVMILLADGQSSSNSRAVAEDAAEAGVEISTIGLGNNIDEGELRMIAGETGGDFYHVQSPEDLPDAFDRVAENTTGVDLPDTDGDSIPDLVEEMNLSMPTGGPGVVGEPLNLDPYAQDTSGDGILDNETVDVDYRVYEEDNATMLTASVTNAAHHPARVDTTGDGVTDAEQVEGWEIEVVDDPSAARTMMDRLENPDVDADPAAFFGPQTASANPLAADTDGDGLSDAEEALELGTNPARADTTGDGIPDDDALDDPREDPTVYTTSPPDASLLEYDQWSEAPDVDWEPGLNLPDVDGPSWNFRYRFLLEDPGGIDSYELTRGDRTVGADADVGGYNSIRRTETLSSIAEGVFTSWRGSQASVESTDIYGNGGSERIHSQSSFYGDVIGKHVDPYAGGVLSGFTHSAAELPELIVTIGGALWDDPIDAGRNFIDMLSRIDGEALAQAIPMMIESTQEQQRLDNPHPSGTAEYEEYADGFYHGYALHFLASMAYGGTITKGATEGANVGQRVSRVVDDIPTSRALRADGSGLKTARIANRLADNGYDTLATQFRTAGKEVAAVKRYVDDVNPAVRNNLDEAERRTLIGVLSANDDASRLVNALGPSKTKTVLRGDGTFNRVANTYKHLPVEQRNRFTNLLRDEDVGQSWLRVVSDERIPTGEVSRAIARTNEVSNFGRVTDFKTGRQVQRSEYPDGWAQVHKADSIVTEYTLTRQETFYRLYTQGENNPWGRFTMRSEGDIRSLSPEQIRQKYAIPESPPNAVARGEVPEGTTMRAGEIAENTYGPGGGTQYTIPKSSIEDSGTLTPWFDKSDRLTQHLLE